MTRYLTLFLLALCVYALVDVVRTPDNLVKYLPKWGWVLLIAITWVLGATIWLLFGRARAENPPAGPGGGPGGGTGRGGGGPRPRGPVAPDDDPAFLRHLDEQTWRAKMEQLRRERQGPPEPEGPGSAPDA